MSLQRYTLVPVDMATPLWPLASPGGSASATPSVPPPPQAHLPGLVACLNLDAQLIIDVGSRKGHFTALLRS